MLLCIFHGEEKGNVMYNDIYCSRMCYTFCVTEIWEQSSILTTVHHQSYCFLFIFYEDNAP